MRKELIDTCVQSVNSSRAQIKPSLAEISMTKAVDMCADEAKSHLSSAISSIEDLQNGGSINPTLLLDSLHSAFDKM